MKKLIYGGLFLATIGIGLAGCKKELQPNRTKINYEINKPTNLKEALLKKYLFWNSQPVTKITDNSRTNKTIIDSKTYKEKYMLESVLPKGYVFYNFKPFENNLFKPTDNSINQIYNFLKVNYSMSNEEFTIEYSKNIICLILNYKSKNVAIMKDNKLCGFVCGMNNQTTILDNTNNIFEGVLLCVDKTLRNYRMSPILMKELARLFDSCIATYVAKPILPTPFSKINLYHRPINFNKLNKLGFTKLNKTVENDSITKFYKVLDDIDEEFYEMELSHLDEVYELYNEYYSKFNFYTSYTKEELKYWLFNSSVVAYVYLQNNKVVDFISYINMNFKTSTNKIINNAFLFLYTATTIPLFRLFDNLLVVADFNKIDTISLLNIMDNNTILDMCKCMISPTPPSYCYMLNYQLEDIQTKYIAKFYI
jgi:glycylpeptide N-tetradecanoyltransferase